MSRLRQADMARRIAEQKELRQQAEDLAERNPDRLRIVLGRDPELLKKLWAPWAEHPDDRKP